ncbi:hypothetical protein TURU_036024 [Turdus rufiventris]|nr:hypothetical protein TURU_036024 [Turdus rufiventris]
MIKNGHSDAEFNPDARPGLEGQEYQVVCGDAVPSVALTRLRHSPVHGAGFFPVQAVPPPSLFKRRMNPDVHPGGTQGVYSSKYAICLGVGQLNCYQVIFSSDSRGKKFTFSKFMNSCKLSGMVNTHGGWGVSQRDLYRWEPHEVLQGQVQSAAPGMVQSLFDVSYKGTCTAQEAKTILSGIKRSVTSRLREMILHVYIALLRIQLEYCTYFWSSNRRNALT